MLFFTFCCAKHSKKPLSLISLGENGPIPNKLFTNESLLVMLEKYIVCLRARRLMFRFNQAVVWLG